MSSPEGSNDRSVFSAVPNSKLRAAADEATNNLQTPPWMALLVAYCAASLMVQGLIDVLMPTGQKVAATIMALIVADSGERKTALEAIFFRVVRIWEELQRERYEMELLEFKRNFKIWKAEASVKEKKFQKKIAKREDAVAERNEWLLHLDAEPTLPLLLRLLWDDSTLPALFQGLRKMPTAGLISSEGGGALNGPIFAEQTKLNAIWSGSDAKVDRVSTESFVLSNVRLTVLIMVQPTLLQKFLSDKGEKARGSGLLARLLVVKPESTQGTRLLQNTTSSSEHINYYDERMQELLEENVSALESKGFERQVIKLSPQAEAAWIDYYNEIESSLKLEGRYGQAKDHGTRLPEMVVRLAAVMHKFEGFQGDISLETFDAARSVVNAASKDFVSIFVPPPQDEQDAIILNKWFDRFRRGGYDAVPKAYGRNSGPGILRNERYYVALDRLLSKGVVSRHYDIHNVDQILLSPSEDRSVASYCLKIRYFKKGDPLPP